MAQFFHFLYCIYFVIINAKIQGVNQKIMKVKKSHTVWNKLVRCVLTPVLKKKFNIKLEKSEIRAPFLVLANHTTDYDAFFIAKSFKDHIYFVMSDHVSSIPVAGKLIGHLVSPIPITKSTVDATTARHIMQVTKAGGAVGIFPEGNKSFAGSMSKMKSSIAKLVKKLKVPVILYNIEGGYLSSPRWSKEKRLGEVRGKIKKVLQPEDYETMSNDDLFKIIEENLYVNAYDIQEQEKRIFDGKNLAENIESFMYVCPECKSMSSLVGECNMVKCKNCDYHAEFTSFGYLDGGPFSRLDKYDEWLKNYVNSLDFSETSEQDIITTDDGFEIFTKHNNYKNKFVGNFNIVLYKNRLEFVATDKKSESFTLPLDSIDGYGIEGMNGLQISCKDGRVLRTKNSKPISALKYTNLISKITGLEMKF